MLLKVSLSRQNNSLSVIDIIEAALGVLYNKESSPKTSPL